MAAKRLPDRPDLEQYKRQAKDLREALAAGDPLALERLRQSHPRPPVPGYAKLADAQLVLAREHDFSSWPAFAERVLALRGASDDPFHVIACDRGSLAVEVCGTEGARALVLFVLAGNVGREHRGIRQIADRLRRAGFGTVLADLLTEEEAIEDAIGEDLRFDVALLSARAELLLDQLRGHRALSGLPLALLCAGSGGAAGVALAARRPEAVTVLVSVASRPDLAGSALARVRAPSLFVVGGEDAVAHGFTRMMIEIFPRDVPSRLDVVRGVGLRFEEGPAAARAAELAIAWLDDQMNGREQAA